MSKYIIKKTDAGKRLDKFLNEKIEAITRSQLQKLIKNEGVLVNGKKTSVHRFLKIDDEVKLVPPKESKIKDNKIVIDKKANAPKYKLEIVKKTKDYIVINKPAGLLVHEAPGFDEKTLVDLLIKKFPRIKKVGDDPSRPGIVHRLDREVSGLMVVARNLDMFEHLKKQFKTRETKKEYIALVYGAPQKPDGTINFNIDRSETVDYKMAAVPEHENRGRKAITDFELIKTIGNFSLLKLTPHTGRTHQIRVHLNAFGLPIVGDLVYHPKKLKIKYKMSRIFLHAQLLGFTDLKGEWQEFQIKLPKELDDLIKKA